MGGLRGLGVQVSLHLETAASHRQGATGREVPVVGGAGVHETAGP
jgi:hypothetical protein